MVNSKLTLIDNSAPVNMTKIVNPKCGNLSLLPKNRGVAFQAVCPGFLASLVTEISLTASLLQYRPLFFKPRCPPFEKGGNSLAMLWAVTCNFLQLRLIFQHFFQVGQHGPVKGAFG